ncbi:hypothetical protein CBS147343_2460 [Aspergillus niger]|uniref:EF-hand domain family protein n=3 Tax=Aspergillus TaxID=5052 RepID=A0A254TXW5_ASPNG|nr:hypothetical protein ASPNIDRAFT_36105 [Aspergillus niger ATCC 1015]KAI2833593.1 hypothetical protein CBS133816_463 [Aspergillus niger]RDK46175.1 hypothetical protein M752DRAFT_289702 [Aspergillus phoenicis ATCC 13157]KAI2861142.1 hypothetical protein CBS12448_5015 [Aspergillus niger]KAI2933504.1 hypothetical protein CBS147320_1360 [Aspergillus niger]
MNFIFGPLSLDSANGEGERDRELGVCSSETGVCELINVGVSLMKWTGDVLHSAFHRVVTAPGEQANVARQSVALLTRPHRTGTMHRLKESAVIPLLREGEVNDDRSVSEWMIWKITKGELRVQTAEEKQVAVTG